MKNITDDSREDLDKTTYMPTVNNPAARTQAKNRLDDTMEMPPVRPEAGQSQAGEPMPHGHVRRLSPQAGQQPGQPMTPLKPKFWTRKKKRAAILGGGFLVALFIGFMLAGYSQEKQQVAQQQRIEQQQMKDRQAKLDGQVADLQQQKQRLQRQISDLEDRQAALEKQQQKNAFDRIMDKVTGNKDASSSERSAVQQKMNEAQSMMKDVDKKIDQAQTVGQQASDVKQKAVETYKENQGVINQALDYAKAGAQLVLGWLR